MKKMIILIMTIKNRQKYNKKMAKIQIMMIVTIMARLIMEITIMKIKLTTMRMMIKNRIKMLMNK